MTKINIKLIFTILFYTIFLNCLLIADDWDEEWMVCEYDPVTKTARSTSAQMGGRKTLNSILNEDPYGNLCNNTCKKMYEPVTLWLDSYDIEKEGMESFKVSWITSNGMDDFNNLRVKNKKRFTVKSVKDIKEVILKMHNDCYYIQSLVMNGHGNAGLHALFLAEEEGKLNVTTLKQLNGLSCAFGKDAQIKMWGCNTGKGVRGEFFLREIGKRLLWTHGGSITAANSFVMIHPILKVQTSLDFSYNTFSVKPGGSDPRYNEGSAMGANSHIVAQISMLHESLKVLDNKMKGTLEIIDLEKYDKMISYNSNAKNNLFLASELYLKALKLGGIDKLKTNEQYLLAQYVTHGYANYDAFLRTLPQSIYMSKPLDIKR